MAYAVYNWETSNWNDVSIELFNNKVIAEERFKELKDYIWDDDEYFVYMEKIQIK